jgi:hypothetical protein
LKPKKPAPRHVVQAFFVAPFWRCAGRQGFRPWMTRTKTTTKAMTSKRWISPPKVTDETQPNIHKSTSATARLSSMTGTHFLGFSIS